MCGAIWSWLTFLKLLPLLHMFSNHPLPLSLSPPPLSPSPLSLPLPPTYAGIVLFYKELARVYTYYRYVTTVLGVLSFSFVRGQALLLNYTLLTLNPAIAIYS